MELELQYGKCENCTGLGNCNKSCLLHLGKALVDFLNRVDMIETRIGEFSSREKDTPYDLVVYGHEIYDLKSPSWILTDMGTILDASNKFMSAYDKTAFQIVTTYCRHIGMSEEETQEIANKVKLLNKNKLLILPFKPNTDCNIDIMINGNLEKKKEAKLLYIRWVNNKETHKLECTLGFSVESVNGNTKVKFNIKEYLDKFRLDYLEMNINSKKKDMDLIKITDHGIIKPIVINDGKTSIAVDGTYVYRIYSGETHIIGYWDTNDKLVINDTTKSKAINKIKDNEDFIRSHKKYIAPYMLYEPNVVLL